MITVIDMASGELICSSTSQYTKSPAAVHENEFPVAALALQEVQPDTGTISKTMPPELADIPVSVFLANH